MSKLKILSTKRVFSHPWESIDIECVKTRTGKSYEYLISNPNDFVVIVPLISKDRVLLVKQYKHGAQATLLGFPAGFINENETPEACARRELEEEVSFTASSFIRVAKLSENPTRCRNSYYIIFATGAKPLENPAAHNDDELEGPIQQRIINVADLLKPAFLNQIKAGPMLSVLPFLLQQIKKSKT